MLRVLRKLNLPAIGAGFLTTGPMLVQFGSVKSVWWTGILCTAIGPVLLAFKPITVVKPSKKRARSKSAKKPVKKKSSKRPIKRKSGRAV